MYERRHRGALLAAAGLAALVVVLIATPDAQGFVLAAWVLVLAGVTAVAVGMVLGFRHQTHVEQESAPRHYLTADWVGGAQLFTVGDRAEPPIPEPTPDPLAEPAADPETPPAVLPHPPSEPELEPVGPRQALRYPRVAAAVMLANAVREVIRPSRAAQ
jgi:hypothetical protein